MSRRIDHRLLTLWDSRRRREQHAESFIALLRQAAALLQAGRSATELWGELAALHDACAAEPAPAATEPPSCCLHHVLRHAVTSQRLGEPPFAAVQGPGQPESWAQLQACLDLSDRAGVALADLLTRMADALEDGQDAHQARETATAGPRSTARLLMGMPLAGVGLTLMTGASFADMLASPLGWIVLGTGGSLTVAGQLWTRRLIRTAEQAT